MPNTVTKTARQKSGLPKIAAAIWFEQPTDWKLRVRRLRLVGWCVAREGEPLVALRGRLGDRIFPGEFDRDRPDVLTHLGRSDVPLRCGFTVDFTVPRGTHRLELQAARADGVWGRVFTREVVGPWRVSAFERALWQEREESAQRYKFFIDQPTDWEEPAHTIYVSGWCLDRNGAPLQAVRASIGRRIFPGNYGLLRIDLAPLFPESKSALVSGFAVAVKVPRGEHSLSLEIKGDDGRWRQFFSRPVQGRARLETDQAPEKIEIFQAGTFFASRVAYWLDEPKDWTRRTRHLRISGWCFAAFGPAVTEVRARIGRVTFPGARGLVRPDVAAAREDGSHALRSGFYLHAVVPRTGGTLVLEARSAGGEWTAFFRRPVRGPLWSVSSRALEAVGDYAEWIRLYDRLTSRDRAEIGREIVAFARQPLFSILVPVYNPNAKWLQRAIDSVRHQLYPNWELCLVDDASTEPYVWPLLQRAARRDPRIKILRREKNGHISAASNDALALATGEFIGLLDHDDELSPTALYFAAHELNLRPELQLLYSDEDKLNPDGYRTDPYFKPDWNPDLFTAQNYLSHFSVYSAELVRAVGGFRTGFEGAQDYDLALRCVEKIAPAAIHHIPHILYHWRIAGESTASGSTAKPYAHEAALRAVQEHFDRVKIPARVLPHGTGYQRVIYPPPEQALVSIVIPTRDRATLLRGCIESLEAKTDYTNRELIIVDNESTEPEAVEYLHSLDQRADVTVIRAAGEFNYSRLNNLGVAQARGTYLALLNNDLEFTHSDWLSEMLGHAQRPEVGLVGARLWYPDGTLQHGGVLLGVGGVGGHAHRDQRRAEHGYFSRAQLTQNLSAVTAACMLLRKEVYYSLGGFDQTNLTIAFNDVDFCLRLRATGLLIVWTPYAEVIHHESASRGMEDTRAKQQRFIREAEFVREKWGRVLSEDPYYNPNLSIEDDLRQFKLAFPPRVEKPWKQL